MSLILALETSTNVCSVALHKGGKLLLASEVHVDQSHATKLALLIDNVLKISDHKPSDLSAVAVASGPGSYTGLRIGTSTAKGICFGLSIPLIAVNSLEVLAFQMRDLNPMGALLCPMIDARRMEVYCLVADASLQIIQPTQAKVIEGTSFLDLLESQRIIFFGNGADKCEPIIQHVNAQFYKGVSLSAVSLGSLAFRKFDDGVFEDVVQFEPFYGKDFVAKKAKSFFG